MPWHATRHLCLEATIGSAATRPVAACAVLRCPAARLPAMHASTAAACRRAAGSHTPPWRHTAVPTCQAGRVLALRLHDDLHLLAAAGLHDAAAGPHAVLLGAGGLDLEGHAVPRGVL